MPSPIIKIESCKYCLDKKGRPKPILDMENAHRMEDGSWMCGVCISERLLKLNGHFAGTE
jgi:hypothetical protein